jgi:eukaryotic-like serine/threonine-protein kinase
MTRYAPTLPSQVGRYQIVRSIGRGAMGQVFLAHDPVLDRPVAIKHLRDDLSLTGEQFTALTKRMEQEARAAARVSHPNLVALHDMGRDPIAGLFLVFEYIEGETLEERLRRGPLPASEAARLSRQLGGALSAAHAAQVVHRDIKPENVLLARTGAKVADFGIARLPDSTLTHPGGLFGTPAYSAPEAVDASGFSAQSDQFSMACTLFEAISARRAFPGDDAAMVAALVQTTEPPPLARLFRLDARVDTVLARALSKNPGSRYASCEEFGSALAEALESGSRATLITEPDGLHQSLAVPRRRLAGSIGGTVLVTLALVAAAGFLYGKGWRLTPAERVTQRLQGIERAGLQQVAWLYERPQRRLASPPAPNPERAAPARRTRVAADAGVESR